MNKRKIVEQLISNTKSEIDKLTSREREEIKEITQSQEEENPMERNTDGEIQSVVLENQAIEDLTSLLHSLEEIPLEQQAEKVAFGSLVKLNTGHILVAHAFPKTTVEGAEVTGISTDSPLYQAMQGLKKGDSFSLKEGAVTYTVSDIS